MQHNLRVHEHGLFLQCMADNIHADRQVFRETIKLLQFMQTQVDNQALLKAMSLFYGGIVGECCDISDQSQYIKTRLLHLSNRLDNIMELQDENQPAIQKIATFLDNLNQKEHKK